jgi:hypothetical protein
MASYSTIRTVRTLAVSTAGMRPRCGFCTEPRGWVFAPTGAGFAGCSVPSSEGRAVNWQDTC